MSLTPQPRAPRERPQPVENRGSMLRASILESALELGVGNGNAVAKWMFSPVEEGNEDFDIEVRRVDDFLGLSHPSGRQLRPRV